MVFVNSVPALGTPLTVTTALPVVVPGGTATRIEVELQLVIVVAGVPLKLTVLLPWVVPKLVPVIVTHVPIGPELGDNAVIVGVGSTVKLIPLL